MIEFKNRQKTKILNELRNGDVLNYKQIHDRTKIEQSTIRGRLSNMRLKGFVEKTKKGYKITDLGIKYLALGESKIEV